MDDEYRLAWANIEGWMTNAKSRPIPARSKGISVRLDVRLGDIFCKAV
jgi:hypothetical protein